MKFEYVHFQQKIPNVFYVAFESLIAGIDQVHAAQNTQKIAHDETCGYALLIVGPDGKAHKPIRHYRGPNAIEHFLDVLLKEKN